jgi:hypothetical protein
MEGNLVADEDLGKQSMGQKKKKLDAEQEVAFEVLSATYVLTLTMKQRQVGR